MEKIMNVKKSKIDVMLSPLNMVTISKYYIGEADEDAVYLELKGVLDCYECKERVSALVPNVCKVEVEYDGEKIICIDGNRIGLLLKYAYNSGLYVWYDKFMGGLSDKYINENTVDVMAKVLNKAISNTGHLKAKTQQLEVLQKEESAKLSSLLDIEDTENVLALISEIKECRKAIDSLKDEVFILKTSKKFFSTHSIHTSGVDTHLSKPLKDYRLQLQLANANDRGNA